ncbi:hypothetical protein HCN44_002377 [Aphidius gifuensis]|uniref:Tim44-like domain-containing protein n=2 Tax=Aphidius gifuensis TaxID=684658 RepID=A0A834Y142_APHGI|nr:hypothetical protein HCN44_002377 [Aphidius gifuensis]
MHSIKLMNSNGALSIIQNQQVLLSPSSTYKTTRYYSNQARRPNFISQFLDNIDSVYGPIYTPLQKLRKRKEIIEGDEKIYEVNNDATGVELHKDSKFYKKWKNFKNNNPYVDKISMVSRKITDNVTDVMGGLFKKSELSETLTEICKTNPSFDRNQFVHDCQTDIIPNILEAVMRGELEILKDWCHEAAYNTIAQPLLEYKKLGYKLDNKILDIDNVDLLFGSITEECGPVLLIRFQTQQVICIRDAKNNVIEGDPDKVLRIYHTWVLGHDNSEMNPKAAWRLLESKSSGKEQFV